ncbi:MAG TPA: trypsin-like peptidase domain-containing protein [Pseudogracilibacillus sp.]|nr:trypsin-like peptidase domain-containing protein [Pseudogracilibacillus sp.]
MTEKDPNQSHEDSKKVEPENQKEEQTTSPEMNESVNDATESTGENTGTTNQTTTSDAAKQETNNKGKKTKKHTFSFLKLIAAGVIGSVLTLGVVTQTNYFDSEDGTTVEPETATKSTAEQVDTSDSSSISDIANNASEAIVGVVNMSEAPDNPFEQFEQGEKGNNDNSESGEEVQKGVGSGVVYKVTDDAAYIVTNNHVIEGASSLKIALENGDKVDGEVVGSDSLSDMAVVKIEGDYDITPLEFGDSDSLNNGDGVVAIGNPLGLDLSSTITSGIVSGTNRTIPVETSEGKWDLDVIQTDAAINPGNSGGALINMDGELVGINSLKIAENGVEGLGFAIPSNEVQDLIDELMENGEIERPQLGVGLQNVEEIPPYYLQQLPDDIEEGAVVLKVDDQSPAEKAGIKPEDVIAEIDGHEVKNVQEVRSYLYKEAEVGDTVTLKVYRDGDTKDIDVKLASS